MSTNEGSIGGGDIEAGCSHRHVTDIEGKITPSEAAVEKMEYGGDTNAYVADTNKWATSLEIILEEVPHYMYRPGHPGRISRIPENLREVDKKSYEPCFLSIGPYHHGKVSLQRMEKKKWVVLKWFLEQKPELTLLDFLREIKIIEPAARSFYTDVEMETDKFVEMLLLDGLYLVVLFCGMTEAEERVDHTNKKSWDSMDSQDKNERVNLIHNEADSMNDNESTRTIDMEDQSNGETSRGENKMKGLRWFWPWIVHDLFLLENQLPFFLLQKIHDVAYGGSGTPLTDTVKCMLHNMLFDYVKLDSELMISPRVEVQHLLHLCHMFFRPKIQQDLTNCQLPVSSQMFRLGSAVQLYKAGVSFKKSSYSTQHSLLDVTFSSSGKMFMPCLHVDDNTNSLLRNLIALEQMKYPMMGLDVSAYAVFLLHLVTEPRDVKLLRKKGIIQHHLASDKEMVHLINRLNVSLAFDYTEDKYSLKHVFHELKRYSESRVPLWRALLKHTYFNNPWTTISLIAASLLVFLSALQTYYAVYSYYHPFFDGHL